MAGPHGPKSFAKPKDVKKTAFRVLGYQIGRAHV